MNYPPLKSRLNSLTFWLTVKNVLNLLIIVNFLPFIILFIKEDDFNPNIYFIVGAFLETYRVNCFEVLKRLTNFSQFSDILFYTTLPRYKQYQCYSLRSMVENKYFSYTIVMCMYFGCIFISQSIHFNLLAVPILTQGFLTLFYVSLNILNARAKILKAIVSIFGVFILTLAATLLISSTFLILSLMAINLYQIF